MTNATLRAVCNYLATRWHTANAEALRARLAGERVPLPANCDGSDSLASAIAYLRYSEASGNQPSRWARGALRAAIREHRAHMAARAEEAHRLCARPPYARRYGRRYDLSVIDGPWMAYVDSVRRGGAVYVG